MKSVALMPFKVHVRQPGGADINAQKAHDRFAGGNKPKTSHHVDELNRAILLFASGDNIASFKRRDHAVINRSGEVVRAADRPFSSECKCRQKVFIEAPGNIESPILNVQTFL